MKGKKTAVFICFLALCVSLVVISIMRSSSLEATRTLVDTKVNSMQRDLKILKSVTNVKHGEIGYITIEGEPGVKYTLTTTYKIGNKSIPVIQWRKVGESGQVTFLWSVSKESAIGTYPLTISGGGEALTTTHAVIP